MAQPDQLLRLLRRFAESGRLAAPEASSQESAELRLLGETMRPTLERHFLTLALLQRGADLQRELDELRLGTV